MFIDIVLETIAKLEEAIAFYVNKGEDPPLYLTSQWAALRMGLGVGTGSIGSGSGGTIGIDPASGNNQNKIIKQIADTNSELTAILNALLNNGNINGSLVTDYASGLNQTKITQEITAANSVLNLILNALSPTAGSSESGIIHEIHTANNNLAQILSTLKASGSSTDTTQGSILQQFLLANNSLATVLGALLPEKHSYRNSGATTADIVRTGKSILYFFQLHNFSGITLYFQVYDAVIIPGTTDKPVYTAALPHQNVIFFDPQLPLQNGLVVCWSIESDFFAAPPDPSNKLIEMIVGPHLSMATNSSGGTTSGGGGGSSSGGTSADYASATNQLKILQEQLLTNSTLKTIASVVVPNKRNYRNSSKAVAELVQSGAGTVFYFQAQNYSGTTLFFQIYDSTSLPNSTSVPAYTAELPNENIIFFDDNLPLSIGLFICWSVERDRFVAPPDAKNKLIEMIVGTLP